MKEKSRKQFEDTYQLLESGDTTAAREAIREILTIIPKDPIDVQSSKSSKLKKADVEILPPTNDFGKKRSIKQIPNKTNSFDECSGPSLRKQIMSFLKWK